MVNYRLISLALTTLHTLCQQRISVTQNITFIVQTGMSQKIIQVCTVIDDRACGDFYRTGKSRSSTHNNTFSALIFSKHISDLFVCTLRILLPFPVLWQQRRVRYPFSRQAVLHGFFQDLNFHRLLTQKARDFPNLFQCFCELRSRNNVLPSSNDSNYCFFHLNSRMD